ncbi:MAG: hypothetical protein Q9182_004571 [Xanthomendoza sp. 2 TL-2023]
MTPNPHRFASSQQSKPKPPLRPQQHLTPQFASTPRFSFGSTQRTQTPNPPTAEAGSSSSPLIPRQLYRFPDQTPTRKNDEIEETESNDEVENFNPKPTSHGQHKLSETIEDAPSSPTHPTPPPPTKRRRLDPIDISPSPSPSPPHSFSSPQQPHTSPQTHPSSPPPTTHPQPFILSPKRPHSTPNTHNPTPRPPFILPPRSPSPPPQPLHPTFSPHRRGAPKFLPAGMAATVRDWVVDVAANTPFTKEGGDWDLRIRAGEVKAGERVTLVHEAGEGKRWILAGPGQTQSRGQVAKAGMVVGVRRPVWDVHVRGEKWGVGVDWGVLDG